MGVGDERCVERLVGGREGVVMVRTESGKDAWRVSCSGRLGTAETVAQG